MAATAIFRNQTPGRPQPRRAPCGRPAIRGKSRRAGFSLVELLVVIAIIGALIGLLLPAVQAARDAARRMQCSSGLRQVALAVLQHEQARTKMPAAGAFPPAAEAAYYSSSYWRVDVRTGLNQGWLTRVLPYLEQQQLYAQFNFALHVDENPSAPQAAQPAMLLCPSDEAQGRMFVFHNPTTGAETSFAKSNVAAFASPYHVDGVDERGAVWLYGITLKEVADGLTNTLMLGEIRTRDHDKDQRGAWALPWSGASLLSVDMHPAEYRRKADESGSGPLYQYNPISLGFTQRPNSTTPDVLYECPDEIGEQVDALPCTTEYAGYISAAPRSNHPGGVNVAYLDGRASFMSNDVDEIVMAYQASINDESVTADP